MLFTRRESLMSVLYNLLCAPNSTSPHPDSAPDDLPHFVDIGHTLLIL